MTWPIKPAAHEPRDCVSVGFRHHRRGVGELVSLGRMRASPFILVFILGCVGCQQAQLGERPSFYDRNNIAEYYGRCPQCQRWVKGYLTHEHYSDASGKPVGAGSLVTGMCKRCKVHLGAHEPSPLTNEARIVTWTLR